MDIWVHLGVLGSMRFTTFLTVIVMCKIFLEIEKLVPQQIPKKIELHEDTAEPSA